MPLSESAATEVAKGLEEDSGSERSRLDRIRNYLRDDPQRRRLEGLPSSTPLEVTRLARLSRVNMLKFIVNTRVQSMYVDGYRTPDVEDHPVWRIWQGNRMDARQIGIHRAALSYGATYVTVLPGTNNPIIRGVSPRKLAAFYAEDDDEWPRYALEKRRKGWRLYDSEAIYTLTEDMTVQEVAEYATRPTWQGEPVCPVVRYRETVDLDDEARGIVEPYLPLQDQINITTFGLQVAQHFGAFRQRYILGWLAESEEEKLRASASKLWTFGESPGDIEVGEFEQTDLDGYISSRESTLKHLATVSQTPAHELIGEMVNISADALVAAEASKQRALEENKTVIGESHEQTLGLVGEYVGIVADPMAFVRWKDTESRALSQLVDALGKAVQMLGVPPVVFWDKLAEALGVSQQEVQTWRDEAASGNPLSELSGLLAGQADAA